MKQKNLKVVDLDDLQPEKTHTYSEDEITVEAKVNIDDIKREAPSFKVESQKKQVTRQVQKKVDPSIIKSKRFKNYKGNGTQQSVISFMSHKYRFDDKRFDRMRVIGLILLAVAGFSHKYIVDDIEAYRSTFISIALPMFDLILKIYELYVRSYIVFIILYLWIFPLKHQTPAMVEVYYDGLTVPSEVFALGRPKRQRIKWDQIRGIDYKNKYSTPFVQILDAKKEVLGEFRLNLDNMEGLYEALDTYCPDENPLRNLFTNS